VIWVSDDINGDGARWLAERLGQAARASGAATIALSGGKSPQPMHRALARLEVPWSAVSVFFGDERGVPPEHPESNYGMARAALLDHVAVAAVHRMEAERPDRDRAAADYAARLPPALDVVVLGIGTDGHTASLFPGTDWSRPTGRRVMATTAPVAPFERMTVTPEVLAAARHVLMIATGNAKAGAVQAALEGPLDPVRVPAQIVRGATWLLDRAAAARLRTQEGTP
jgi:6-phosphogluconolactonase